MTMEEFDAKIVAIGDWYAAEIKRLGEEFSARLDAASVGAEGLPPHLVTASIERVVLNLEAIVNQST